MTPEQLIRNQAFELLSPAQKRIAIAKDALAQIELDVYQPTIGSYVQIFEWTEYREAQEFLHSEDAVCLVCAKGALFASVVRFKNEVSMYDLKTARSGFITQKLDGIFDKGQLDLMEVAFEGYSPVASYLDFNYDEYYRAKAYKDRYLSSSDRLKSILENIIRFSNTCCYRI